MSLDYDAIPYRGRPIAATSPARMALAAIAYGGPRPTLERARVLELGCGDGANLLPLAFFHPGWELLGVDSSARAIEAARAGAGELGLTNVRFEQKDLADLEIEAHHDFVIAHGVYSWIDAGRRAALRARCAEALAPRGLAYVSFNAMPGWGVRGRVRDALIRDGAARGGEPSLASARARLEGLAEMAASVDNDWATHLRHEIERARVAPDGYLAHEYLAPDNQAFWLGEVTRDFAEHGLSYAGDGLEGLPEGFVDPALRERAIGLSDDPIAREELVDLITYRQLRAAIFARADAPAGGAASLLDEARIAGALRRRSDPFDLSDATEEIFDSPYGREVRVRSPLSKVALLVMADRYPRSFAFEELLEECRDRLGAHGYGIRPGDVGRLRDGLATLASLLDVELRLEEPPLRQDVGARPRASHLSRFEAAIGDHLTTPIHTMLPLEPLDRAIVTRLDGSRSASEVAAAIGAALDAGELELEGAPSGGPRLGAFVEERAERTITLLSWWGLLDGG